ncbi:PD-(D/E)XK nuclease superfamily protein [Rhizobium sp. PP-F2F-G38]|nr:PD-(D/E)XK nuclease superfamily protein [Rhizobium sp. PP-F2F-G38]
MTRGTADDGVQSQVQGLIGRVSVFLAWARPELHPITQPPDVKLVAADVERLIGLLRGPLEKTTMDSGYARDLWRIVGLGRNEVQTARVLTWLLDPRGSHGFASAFLESFWKQIPIGTRPFEMTTARRVTRETVPLGDFRNRVDIEIEADGFVVFVEAKIDAVEGERQLLRYQALAMEKAKLKGCDKFAVVLVAPFVPAELPPHCYTLNWRNVSKAIEEVVRSGANKGRPATALAASFADHVRRF